MNNDTARDIATSFGEAVASLVQSLGPHLAGDPEDEIERQLEALIDGAPLVHADAGVVVVRSMARQIAQAALREPARTVARLRSVGR